MYGSLETKLEYPSIVKCMNENDIVLFNETWTNVHSNIEVDDFVTFSKHRLKTKNAK